MRQIQDLKKANKTYLSAALLIIFGCAKAISATTADLNALYSPVKLQTQSSGLSDRRIIDFLDNPDILSAQLPLERNINKLVSTTKKSVTLELKPWADGRWNHDFGILGNRYADPGFVQKNSWEKRFQYVKDHPAQEVLKITDQAQREAQIDLLSPSEKYDLLVGDNEFALTKSSWAEGEYYFKKGTLASWFGICEGSAAAGALSPEPQHSVDLKSPTGDLIRFHILDIKGLEALHWSSYTTVIPIAGSRCLDANPKTDENGIIKDADCFNTNPATFYIAALNFLGLQKRTFFMNRKMNLQVWNVPILSYDVKYFNIINGAFSSDIAPALVPIDQVPVNSYTPYRTPGTAFVLGVEMRVKVARGSTTSRDKVASATISEIKYSFDLEINAEGIILGGEWRSTVHPDFIWAVEQGYQPQAMGDKALGMEAKWGAQKFQPSGNSLSKILRSKFNP